MNITNKSIENLSTIGQMLPLLYKMKTKYDNNAFTIQDVLIIEDKIRQLKKELSNHDIDEEKYTLIYYAIEALQSFIETLRHKGFFRIYAEHDIEDVKEKSSMLALALLDNPEVIKTLPRNRYMRLCSIHNEKTPSLMIYETTGSYFCHGCHASGNVITYLMKQYNIDFITALETLAKAFSVELPKRDKTKENLFLIHKIDSIYKSNRYLELCAASKEKNRGSALLRQQFYEGIEQGFTKTLKREEIITADNDDFLS